MKHNGTFKSYFPTKGEGQSLVSTSSELASFVKGVEGGG